MFSRPIHIGLSPNISADDYWLAVKSLFTPWSWKRGKSIEKVENWFKDHFEVHLAISFNAGRSALLAILESLNLFEGKIKNRLQALRALKKITASTTQKRAQR